MMPDRVEQQAQSEFHTAFGRVKAIGRIHSRVNRIIGEEWIAEWSSVSLRRVLLFTAPQDVVATVDMIVGRALTIAVSFLRRHVLHIPPSQS